MAADIRPTTSASGSGDLMALETPLLRVSRPVAACQRCRAAKIKCDGKLPACTACEKSNKASECASTNDQFARGKERSYVATLEGRVEKLERKLLEAQARRKSSINMLDYDDAATPRRLSVDMLVNKKPPSRRALRRKEASDIDELAADFGLLAVNATARDFYGFNSTMSYAKLILSSCSKEPLPSGMTKPLPPRYAATPLIQHYFHNLFPLLPIFEEASFYASVDAVYNSDRNARPFDHWSVRMVLALACISCSDSRGDTHYVDAIGHVNAAMEWAEDVLHPGFITNIQALVLLVEYATMDPQHFDSWHLIGAASRALVDLGMHQDPSKSSGVSRAKLELRRRVYWCVYTLDRSTTLVNSRAFSFSDDSAHVAFPFQGSTSPTKTPPPPKTHLWLQSFDAATNLFKLRQIQSAWYNDLFQTSREAWADPYPYIWRSYASMTEWYNNISATTLPSTRTYFELELLYSYVYILSPSSRCPRISSYAKRLIFEHCIAYSTNMLALLNDASSPTTKVPLTFYDAMRTYMTGRQFLDVLSRNLDILLDPMPPIPPSVTSQAMQRQPLSHDDSNVDPFAAPDLPEQPVYPPPFPAPVIPPQNSDLNAPPAPTDPVSRAVAAINDFTAILSRFGARFGHISWRDRFQADSAPMLNQLFNRASSVSPSSSPRPNFAMQQQQPFGAFPTQGIPPPPLQPGARAYEWGNTGNVSPPMSATAPSVQPFNFASMSPPQVPVQPQQQRQSLPSGQVLGMAMPNWGDGGVPGLPRHSAS